MRPPEIISVQGPSCVGKTSISKRLTYKKGYVTIPEHVDYLIRFGLDFPPPPRNKQTFLENQRFFLNLEKQRWSLAREAGSLGKLAVFDRDSLDTLIFTFAYPYVLENSWTVLGEMKDEFIDAYRRKTVELPQLMLVMTAPWAILSQRANNDFEHPRQDFRTIWFFDMFTEMVIRDLPPAIGPRLAYLDGTKTVDENEQTIEEVLADISKETNGNKDKLAPEEIVVEIITKLLSQEYTLERLFSQIGAIDIQDELSKKW